MQRKLIILVLLSVSTTVVGQVNAPSLSSDELAGVWEGRMETNFQGQVYRSSVTIQFDVDQKVVFKMLASEEGRYKVFGDSISILIGKMEQEQILLYKVHLEQDALTASIRLPSDPPELTSIVHLLKVIGQSEVNSHYSDSTCNSIGMSEEVRHVIRKFSLKCPISIPDKMSWYEHSVLGQALSEIIEASSKYRPEIKYDGKRFYYRVDEWASLRSERIVRPLLQEPERFYGRERERERICPTCRVKTPSVEDLSPKFITNGKVDLNRVWSSVLSAAETVEGVNIDLGTQKLSANERVITTKFRRLTINDPGFIIAEQVILKVKDAYEQWGASGEAVEISVISKILRRGISERQWISINLAAYARAANHSGI